ncbi:MAG: MBOAT family O-acyltransferase [Planctomycetota bacterium]
MSFDSPSFWLFLPAALAAWRFLPFAAAKLCLLIASLGFYAWWDVRFVGLIAVSSIVDFAVGARLARTAGQGARRALLLVSLTVNLGLLAVFKYTPFAARSFASLTGGELQSWAFADWIIPVGISFYTFQTLSYTIDIYRGQLEPAPRFTDFFLYVAFFPQLVAGPIVRARQLLPQLERRCTPSLQRIELGVYRIVQGLFLKMCVADVVAPAVGRAFDPDAIASLSTLAAWTGAVLFGVQIFADFAGYSGIAIGIAMLLGLRFPENFRAPYIARGLSEFWTRWHITLSQWLRDYLYVPLGGNRGGGLFTSRNLLLTMLLGGLWHGAAWTFVVWGALHGIGLVVERAARSALGLPRAPGRPRGLVGGLRAALAMGVTFAFVHVCWVFFRAETFADAWAFVGRMFAFAPAAEGAPAWEWRFLLASLPVALMHGAQLVREWFGVRTTGYVRALSVGVMVFLLVVLHRAERPDFIYFQF